LVGAADDVALRNGALSDLAPTLLSLLQISQPAEMTGISLLIEAQAAERFDAGHQASA
jgi:2,3-bisphosphoglycerate-independent phosphoglycerate mutase